MSTENKKSIKSALTSVSKHSVVSQDDLNAMIERQSEIMSREPKMISDHAVLFGAIKEGMSSNDVNASGTFKKFNELFDELQPKGMLRMDPKNTTKIFAEFSHYILKNGVQDNLEHLNETGLKILSMIPNLGAVKLSDGEPVELMLSSKGMGQFADEIRVLKGIRQAFVQKTFEDSDPANRDVVYDTSIHGEPQFDVQALSNLDDMLDNVYNRYYFRDYDISEMLTDLDCRNNDDMDLFLQVTRGTSRTPTFRGKFDYDSAFTYESSDNQTKLNVEAKKVELEERIELNNDLISHHALHQPLRTDYQFITLRKPFDPTETPEWKWSQSTTNDLFKIFAYEIKGNYPETNPNRIRMINNVGNHILSMIPELQGLEIRGEKVEKVFARKGLGELADKVIELKSKQEDEYSMQMGSVPGM
jgi:hypothetical protein